MCRTLRVSRTWLWPVKVKCVVSLLREKVENLWLSKEITKTDWGGRGKRCQGRAALEQFLDSSSTTSWGSSPQCLLCVPRAIGSPLAP